MTNLLPPLRARKYPWLALVLGLLLSGEALGICFRSWTNVIVPTVAWLVPAINGVLLCLLFRRREEVS